MPISSITSSSWSKKRPPSSKPPSARRPKRRSRRQNSRRQPPRGHRRGNSALYGETSCTAHADSASRFPISRRCAIWRESGGSKYFTGFSRSGDAAGATLEQSSPGLRHHGGDHGADGDLGGQRRSG